MGNYTHLSSSDRRRFYTFLEMKLSMKDIANRLGKHRSTLYRELGRNKEPEGYLPRSAQLKAEERAKQKCLSKIEKDGYLRDYIVRSLKKGWSPEQISGRMKYHKLTIYVCPESIYQFVYQSRNKELYHCLPYKKSKRQKRYSRQKSPCRYGKIRLITERPEDIATRKRFGHWEGDTIQFKGEKEKIVTTLVERKSRMVMLIKNNRKYSQEVMQKIKERFASLPEKMCKSITFDQGVEFADYRQLEQNNLRKIYYCETHSPWQKGSNENMNGRLRWHLPKDADIARINQEELDRLAAKNEPMP